VLLFTSITIVGVFSFIGITFVNALDNSRAFSARADWRNEAIMLANRFISDPTCLGYTKKLIRYTNESGEDLLVQSNVNVPLAIDRYKLFDTSGEINVNRLDNCMRLNSPEYNLFYEVTYDELDYATGQPIGLSKTGRNLDASLKNNQTAVTVQLPVKVIDDNGFIYGLLTVTMSVSVEYMQAKVL